MGFWNIILEILLLLCAAFLLGLVAQRLRQSAIVGYLLAGTILGPLLFNRQAVTSIAELGVALLLFSIGLEFSLRRLKSMGAIALGGGSLQVMVTLGVFALIFSLNYTAEIAWALGAMVALSSTAVVLRVLVDRTEVDSARGRTALSILLLQDIAVVPLVLFVTLLSVGGDVGDILTHMGKTVAAAAGLMVFFYLLFYKLMPRFLLSGGIFANRELIVLLAVIMAIGSTWVSHALGLSPALGAFLAGMLLAESPFATQIRADIGSLRTLFVTLFFTSIGMLANPAWYLSHWSAVLLWLIVVIVAKTMIIYAICLLFKKSHPHALATGISLAQIGEFSFVLATIANSGGLINQEIFYLIVTITILSMFFAPYMVAHASPLANAIIGLLSVRYREKLQQELIPPDKTRANLVIVGFGPAGQRVAESLAEQSIPAKVIELNPTSAAKARHMGLQVHLGDASRSEVLLHAGIKDACLVVVTVPDPRTSRTIIETVRQLNPNSTVIARGRYHIAQWELQKAGANLIVDEENMIGRVLAREITNFLDQAKHEAMPCALAGERPPNMPI